MKSPTDLLNLRYRHIGNNTHTNVCYTIVVCNQITNMKYLTILILVITFVSCNDSSDKILGNWERINDEQKGMVITVFKEKDNYVGKISYVSEENKNSFWAIQDVK